MDKLPRGWVNCHIEDIANSIQYGYTGKTIENGDIKYLRITDIQNNFVDWEQVPFVEINIKEADKYLLRENDIVFARTGATAGKSFLIENLNCNSVFASYLIRIVPRTDKILPKYLYSYFQSPEYWSHISGNVEGAAQPNFNGKKLARIPFPLPPLSEQIRIVSKLDALFTRIDKSIALLEENIKHTKGLMASVLEEVFRDAERNWKFKKLKFVTDKIGSGSTPRGGNDSYKASGISLIRSMNIYDGEFRQTGLAFIDEIQAMKLANVAVNKDDVLLNITGASVARCAIVDESILPARVNQHVSIIRPTSKLNPHFLQAYLTSPSTKSKLLFNSGGGATREAITKSMIENLEVPIPEDKVQERIINYIQKVKEVDSKIIIEQQSKLTYLKALKSSLLDQAFKGEF
jgi:restriction endonuclease S subunit